MTAKESLNRDYGLLARFLKGISLRLQISIVLEFFFLLCSSLILILLGSLFILRIEETFPYLPFFYAAVTVLFLFSLFCWVYGGLSIDPPWSEWPRDWRSSFPT